MDNDKTLREIKILKANIGENMTIYVLDKCNRSDYPKIANKLMAYNNLYAEQVGFLEEPVIKGGKAKVRLQMMGGEFCGNATRGMACLAIRNEYDVLDEGKEKKHLFIETSGVDKEVELEVEKINKNHYISKLMVPDALQVVGKNIKIDNELYEYIYVKFSGITHTIFFLDESYANDNFYKKLLDNILHNDNDAFGFMIYDENKSTLHPAVYVKDTDSLVYERSCGSGSVSTAVAVSYKYKKDCKLALRQEGGTLEVEANYINGKITNLILKGDVIFCVDGVAYI